MKRGPNFVNRAEIHVYVNRTPITGEVAATLYKTYLCLSGCNISDKGDIYLIDIGRRPVRVFLSIITPYMPITTNGKSPDLGYLKAGITDAIQKSIGRAKRNAPKESKRSQKEIVIEHIDEGMEKAGGGHGYSLRQLFYAIRPFVITERREEPTYDTFARIMTDIENVLRHDLEGMYRDDRGVVSFRP